MKKLINGVADVVPELLQGLAALHPGLAVLQGHRVMVRADVAELRARGEVALISGGGSGHEPAHAGYVGPGMLTAAVAGDVFTSPSTDAVLAAIEAVAGPAGVLLIVKNYTGDRLNFGLAAEIARTRGHAVDMVVVADDAALQGRDDHAGRRGIAGTVLVHKVAGAAAAAGKPLAEVRAAAQRAADTVSSMGVGLSACTVPAAGSPGFALGEAEIELGLGIHGEAGVRRAPLASADALVGILLQTLREDLSLGPGEPVALLVNNLGATPAMELAIVADSALRQLREAGIVVERAWAGTFLSAIDMAGVSLTLMRLDAGLRAALDESTQAPAWPGGGQVPERVEVLAVAGLDDTTPIAAGQAEDTPTARVLLAVASALEAAEPELTRLDQVVGDGDLGISLARGAQALRAELPGYPLHDVPGTLRAVSATLRRALGGTSGPLYAIGLLRAAQAWDATPGNGAAALQAAADGIAEVGGAKAGDRTMLDALIPAAQAWPNGALKAVEAAQAGVAATAGHTARRGRASYLGERALGHVDPGAQAVAIWLAALVAATSHPQ